MSASSGRAITSLNPKVPCSTKPTPGREVTGHNVRYVLLFGLVAIVIAFAAILAFDVYR
jgi:hypothetical protein